MSTVVVCPTHVASYPEGGGHLWVYMQYVHALRALGCDVYWLEKFVGSGQKTRDETMLACFFERMRRYGLEGKVILYRSENGGPRTYLGARTSEVEELFRRADLLLNFHYCIDAEILHRFRRTALVDIDPGLLQHWIARGELEVPQHDVYFTTGETVGTPEARFSDCGLPWKHIRPAIALELWPYVADSDSGTFTTVSSWMGGEDGEWVTDPNGGFYDNNKRVSFLEFLQLPRAIAPALELALCLDESQASEKQALRRGYGGYEGDRADRRKLVAHGWRVRHAHQVAGTPEDYRAYIQTSRGEFSCAKPSCMRLQNAWVSDRTLCYLASGRPAVVQHTGPSRYLPDGEGLFRFSSLEEAITAFEAIDRDYEKHRRAARAIAETLFDAKEIVRRLLDQAL